MNQNIIGTLTDVVALRPANALGDVLAVIFGLLLIGAFMHGGHVALFGASPV